MWRIIQMSEETIAIIIMNMTYIMATRTCALCLQTTKSLPAEHRTISPWMSLSAQKKTKKTKPSRNKATSVSSAVEALSKTRGLGWVMANICLFMPFAHPQSGSYKILFAAWHSNMKLGVCVSEMGFRVFIPTTDACRKVIHDWVTTVTASGDIHQHLILGWSGDLTRRKHVGEMIKYKP